MIGVCGIGVNWINRLFKVKGFLQLERSPFRFLMQLLACLRAQNLLVSLAVGWMVWVWCSNKWKPWERRRIGTSGASVEVTTQLSFRLRATAFESLFTLR